MKHVDYAERFYRGADPSAQYVVDTKRMYTQRSTKTLPACKPAKFVAQTCQYNRKK